MIGVILAGGRSRRMGTDKAIYAVAGRPMLTWVREAMEPACDGLVIVGRENGADGLETVPDPGEPYRGPLAGLVAALHRYPTEKLALVSVDQPWVRTGTLRRLEELAEEMIVVPVDNGVRQTTCAVYPPGVVGHAEGELAGGGSLQSVLDVAAFRPVVDWNAWGEDGRSWFSVDTPQDVEEGLARFGLP